MEPWRAVRNDTATRLTGYLLGRGVSEAEAWAIISDWNQVKNKPPLDSGELKRTF